jgi:hypothetical protein
MIVLQNPALVAGSFTHSAVLLIIKIVLIYLDLLSYLAFQLVYKNNE